MIMYQLVLSYYLSPINQTSKSNVLGSNSDTANPKAGRRTPMSSPG